MTIKTIWERVNDAIGTLTGVIFAASKLQVETGGIYPDEFITYFLVSSPPEQHADNEETMRSYKVQVNIFSRNGLINLPNVDGAMTAAGFLRGNIVEIPLDIETRHYGLGTEYFYLESEE